MSLLSRRTGPAQRKASVLLRVEELENRIVPAILTVGAGKMFTTLGAAAAAANDGDTIRLDAGTFTGAAAVAVWSDSNITIEGVGASRTVLDATGFNLPNRKGIFTITGSNVTVRNIEFIGAHDSAGVDKNWAGIRQEGDNLTVQNCYFHNNDNGILGGGSANSEVIVEYSEFSRNGYGDGQSHNMYIGDIRSFTLRHSYTHDAIVGHDVKSRAVTNIIVSNWIGGTGAGSESYEINLPDGGTSYIIGNVIRQDASTQNSTIVDWGSENNGGANPSLGFYFINNTVINDRSAGGTYVRMLGATLPSDVRLVNNIFAGSGTSATTFSGPATAQQLNNVKAANPGFVNAAARDYQLTSVATTVINQGIDPGSANSVDLEPVWQYLPTAQRESRVVWGSAIDLGAYEFGSAPPTNQPPTVATQAAASANPVTGTTVNLSVLGADDAGAAGLTYTWSLTGTPPAGVTFSVNGTNAARNTTATFSRAGVYAFRVTIRDAAGLTTTSNVNVTVAQKLTSIAVTPGAVTLGSSGAQQFVAQGRDQFGAALSVQPAFTWALLTGSIGSITTAGRYTAPATGNGAATVRATSGTVSGTATVTVQGASSLQPLQQANDTNGLVVVEAENFDGRSTQNGKSWAVSTARAGYSGTSALVATTNTGVTNDTNYVTASPRLDYQVNFVKTGIHYVWVRGLGPTANDDSLHVGLDGAAVASADKVGNLTTAYGWTRNTLDGVVATINVTTVGVHTINVWMREDGVVLDKLLLTTNASYTPTGTGPTPSARTAPAVNGLTATYFDNKDFTGASVSRIDSTVNFNWGSGSPAAGIGADTFSARWTGKIKPRYSQTYTFYTTSDDGVRLWINGQLLIDQWNDHSPTTHSGTITLQANQLYDIRLEYYENGGGAVMKLEWQSASQAREVVPLSQLFSR
ncbi:MAG: Ig-like domain-containing protein [Planctomycetia bacterium]|nr:Ig-like domain-containing protein [Planctomycetia bacterium]